jgi:hypothetical protein
MNSQKRYMPPPSAAALGSAYETNSGYGLTVKGLDSMVLPSCFSRAMKVTFCSPSPSAGK